jgi:CDP-diacylglycerol---glycerol-3-phosphate 3-phosphatidyltransferase
VRGKGVEVTSAAQPTFGPSALATPANAVTVLRILGTPLFVGLILTQGATWLTAGVGAVLACSDGIDGWVARRQGTTRSGAFLDPLADKAIVLGALFALAALGSFPWLPVILITIREVAMSIYRWSVGRHGVSIPARTTAKLKTIVQDLAVATCLVPPLAPHHTLQLAAIWVAAALTLITGVQYVLDGRRTVQEATP